MMTELNKKDLGQEAFVIFQSFIPAPVSNAVKEKVKTLSQSIADQFSLNNTPLLIQLIINQDDVKVVEFSARIGGASKHRLLKSIVGFDILHAYVDSYLGITPHIEVKENNYLYSRNHIYTYSAVFGSVENHEELIREGIIEEFVFYKTSGMKVGDSLASRDRIGSFLVKAESKEQLLRKIAEAVSRLRVYDTGRNEIMRRDIFE